MSTVDTVMYIIHGIPILLVVLFVWSIISSAMDNTPSTDDDGYHYGRGRIDPNTGEIRLTPKEQYEEEKEQARPWIFASREEREEWEEKYP